MKTRYSILVLLLLMQLIAKAQMKIGDNSTSINSASLLELETTNKGLVFPRVSLTSVSSSSPLPAGLLTGTVVYNTNISTTGGSGVGIYYWDGSKWNFLANSTTTLNNWSLTGNAITNSSTNFLGTTNNYSLAFRTNNTQRMLIDSLGDVAIGSVAFDPISRERLLVDYGTTTSNNIATFKGSINDYLQIGVQNSNSGTGASSDFVATANDGTDSTNYIDMGINSSTYAPSVENWGGPHDGYLYTNSRYLLIGTQVASSDIIFMVGGGQISQNTAFRIDGPTHNIILGRGDNTSIPFGNTIRAPNALGTNISGATLTLKGGSATGTGTGGAINMVGGTSVTGTAGAININVSSAGATNINTGTSTSNTTIGGNANNVLLPKFSTVGGIYYTSLSTGQISTTGANMTWDSINQRLGIGTSSPAYKLHVAAASNPLYLGGVQATSSFNTDSILTIYSGVVKKAPYSSLTGSFLSSFSATAPLTYNNTTGVFAINQSGASADGYLSSTDWNTFNNKVGSITLNAPSIFSTPVNFSVASGAATGTLSSKYRSTGYCICRSFGLCKWRWLTSGSHFSCLSSFRYSFAFRVLYSKPNNAAEFI